MSTTTAPAAQAPAPAGGDDLLPVSRKAAVSMSLFAGLALVVFGLLAPSGVDSTLALSLPGDETLLSPLRLPTQATGIALGIVLVALAGYSWLLTLRHRSTPAWVAVVFGALWLFSFLVWATADKTMSLTGLLQGSLLLAVPLVFGSLSGVLCERAGVINIAIEGHLLAGAFAGAVVASLTGSLWLGLAAAPLAGRAAGPLAARSAPGRGDRGRTEPHRPGEQSVPGPRGDRHEEDADGADDATLADVRGDDAGHLLASPHGIADVGHDNFGPLPRGASRRRPRS